MRDQEIIGLQEAYSLICESKREDDSYLETNMKKRQENNEKAIKDMEKMKGHEDMIKAARRHFDEEVELAAQYFYEMGLNEEGVNILIEELGVSQFANFVYDIAEESLLVEARAGGVKIEPKLSSGKPIQGKPKAASLKSLRKKKAERAASEEKASAEKPSGLKASLQRQSAIANAKKQQPKKKGILDRVAGAVLKGMERDRAAREKLGKAARETGAVIQKAAKGAGHVAREFGSGMSTAAKVGKRVVTGEEVELWVNQLVEEGYDLSEYTWDDMVEIYMNEGYKDLPTSKMVKQATKHGQRGGMAHITQREVERTPKGLRTITGSRERAEKLGNIKRSAYTKAAKMTAVSQHHDPESSKEKSSINRARGTKSNIRPFTRTAAEEVELWVNSLIEEGYDLSEYTWDDMVEIYISERKYEHDEKLPSGKTPRKKMERKSNEHLKKASSSWSSRGGKSDPRKTSSYKSRYYKLNAVKSSVERGEDPRNTQHGQDNRKIYTKEYGANVSAKTVDNEKSAYTPGGLRAHQTKAGGYRTFKRPSNTSEEVEMCVNEERKPLPTSKIKYKIKDVEDRERSAINRDDFHAADKLYRRAAALKTGKKLSQISEEEHDVRQGRRLERGGVGARDADRPYKPIVGKIVPASPEERKKAIADVQRRSEERYKKIGITLTKSGEEPSKVKENYDIILSHLLDEGYADTKEAAEAIMVNMSEEWFNTIVEEYKDFPTHKVTTKAGNLMKTGDKKKTKRGIKMMDTMMQHTPDR